MNHNGRTSFASLSDEIGTTNRDRSTARKTTCASGSLLPDTARKPSESSTRMEAIVRTATGRTRLEDDSSGSRLKWSWRGGRDAAGERYTCEER